MKNKINSFIAGLVTLALIAVVTFSVGPTRVSAAAVVTHGIMASSTAAATSYATGSFTPAAGDLLVAFVYGSATVAAGTMTDSQGLGFTKVTSAVKSGSGDTGYLFIANNLAAASSMTVTFDCTGDAASGAIIFVARVSGMSKTAAAAALQTAKQENQAAAGTPSPSFASSANTNNPTLGFVFNNSNPAAMTPPVNWTEDANGDDGYLTPTSGGEYVYRNSGFNSTNIQWNSTSATAFGDIIVELDSSAATTATPPAAKYAVQAPMWINGGAVLN